MSTTHRSLCRFGRAHCAVRVRVEDGRVVNYDPISGIPVMSAIPVNVRRVRGL
jgi:hypothetical protein